MTNSPQDVLAWIGKTVVGGDGDKLGTVEDVYLDNASGEPAWLAVKTGLFGSRRTFVPLREARMAGDDLQVPYDADVVKGAPHVDVDGELTPEEEDRLYRHYDDRFADGGGDADAHADADADADAGAIEERPMPGPGTVPAGPVGGTDGPDAGAPAAEVAAVPLPASEGEGVRRPRVRRYVIERVIVEDDAG